MNWWGFYIYVLVGCLLAKLIQKYKRLDKTCGNLWWMIILKYEFETDSIPYCQGICGNRIWKEKEWEGKNEK